MNNSNQLSDYLQVWGFDDNMIIYKDGSVGFGIRLTPLDISCLSDETINHIKFQLNQLLNAIPSGVSLQFVQDIERDSEEKLYGYESLNLTDLEIQKNMVFQKSGHFKKLNLNKCLPFQNIYIFVRTCLSDESKKNNWFNWKRNEDANNKLSNVHKNKNRTNSTLNSLTQDLKNLGIECSQLTSDEIVTLIYNQWNPGKEGKLTLYDPEDIRESVMQTDVGLYEKGFSLSSFHHRVISLVGLPEYSFSGMSSILRELPFETRSYLTVHVPDQNKEIQKLQTQRRIAFSLVSGNHNSVTDIESKSKYVDLENLLESMIAEGEKVYQVSFNVLLRSESEQELQEKTSETLSCLRKMNGSEGFEESLATFEVFSEVAIPHAKAFQRTKYLKTSNLSDFLPLYGSWSGHENPRILLRSRSGSLFYVDPFDSSLTNYNHIISGGSGSGKSFLTNILLLQMMKEKPKIFIIDIGGSYEKICNNLGGQYIPLGVGHQITVNPFDLSESNKEPTQQKIKFLTGLVEQMVKEQENSSLSKYLKSEIEEAIINLYKNKELMTLSKLRHSFENHFDKNIKKLGSILKLWCGDSPYGKFLDGKTTIHLEKDLVVFDLKGLESYPDLQSICLFLITDYVWREVQKDRNRMKFLVFDECWKLLKDPAGIIFIEEVFRTFRKYYAGAVAISQNIDDFAQSDISSAILSNASTKWVLMQKGADQRRLQEVLSLNTKEVNLISSLSQKRGEYSEAFLISQDKKSVVVIESTPLEYWLATTDPRDLNFLEQQKSQYSSLSTLDLIKKLSLKYPKGVTCS